MALRCIFLTCHFYDHTSYFQVSKNNIAGKPVTNGQKTNGTAVADKEDDDDDDLDIDAI